MSDLTSTFNSASAGPSGEAGTVSSGPTPVGPSGSNAASAEAQGEPGFSPISENGGASERNTVQFSVAGGFQHAEPDTEDGQDRQTANPGVAAAKAELEVLERAKLKPSVRKNLDPDFRIKNAVDLKCERQRFARACALKAYVCHIEREPDLDEHQASAEDLAPSL